MTTFSNFALRTIGRNEERTEKLYHLLSMRFAKSCAPPYGGTEGQLHSSLALRFYATSTGHFLRW